MYICTYLSLSLSLSIYIYIYVYMYTASLPSRSHRWAGRSRRSGTPGPNNIKIKIRNKLYR